MEKNKKVEVKDFPHKSRSFRPYMHSIFLDYEKQSNNIFERLITITDNFLYTRKMKPAISFRYLSGGANFVVTLDEFNKRIKIGQFGETEINCFEPIVDLETLIKNEVKQ